VELALIAYIPEAPVDEKTLKHIPRNTLSLVTLRGPKFPSAHLSLHVVQQLYRLLELSSVASPSRLSFYNAFVEREIADTPKKATVIWKAVERSQNMQVSRMADDTSNFFFAI
jgi:hypothetical protein